MDFELDDELRAEIYAHAEAEQPREACGLIVATAGGPMYTRCANIATDGAQFLMDPNDYAHAEETFDAILAVVHSHPNASANPSMADRVCCEKSGLLWLIMGWPSGTVKELQPEGWMAPYKGREFHHGVLDCYTIVQDWYRRELAILLPDFEREDAWWEERPDHPAQDLYMQHFAEAGFVPVFGQPQRHDGFLMQIRSDKANHAGIYLGNGVMLHHPYRRPSEEVVYNGYYQRHTMALVRHISQITPAEAESIALSTAQLKAAA